MEEGERMMQALKAAREERNDEMELWDRGFDDTQVVIEEGREGTNLWVVILWKV